MNNTSLVCVSLRLPLVDHYYLISITQEVLGKVTVTAVRQNTPARISGLKYNDEIIALAFADIDSIDVQMGSLKTDDIATAGGAGKSLILVVKRG